MEKARIGAVVLCFAGALALAGWVVFKPSSAVARIAAPATAVSVADVTVEKGADTDALADEIAIGWQEVPFTLVVGDVTITQPRGAFGGSLDRERLRSQLRQANDATSAMRRVYARTSPGEPLSILHPVVLDESAQLENLANLKDEFDRRPVDARINPRTGEIQGHEHGRILDVHGTLDAMRRAMIEGADRVEARVTPLPARRTVEDLDGIDIGEVLGSYETRYANSERSRNRTFNLRVAAAKLDGLVVLPGETFDFNEAVGERSEANGFRPAPVIAGGELVDGVGGGTCQVAGTLHAAAFYAGLPIEERSAHSRPSTYIFMGLDAVVSYPQLNMRFRNDLPFPVALGFSVEGGVARAEIRGARTGRLVTLVRRIDEITPYMEREIEDSSLPRGTRVLRQRGVPGFQVQTWRIIRETDRNQARRTHGEDHYPPTTQIWRVGAGGQPDDDYVAPEGDTHGEYTADEYLTVSQGHGVRGTQIVRRAGRSGLPGWTARLGFPQVSPPAE